MGHSYYYYYLAVDDIIDTILQPLSQFLRLLRSNQYYWDGEVHTRRCLNTIETTDASHACRCDAVEKEN